VSIHRKPAVLAVPLALALGLGLALAGCGDDAVPAAAGGKTPITVGVIPIVETAAVYVAESKGYFDEAGLDVTIEPARTSSVIVPGVVSGTYDIGFSNLVTLLLADKQGLGLTAVAAGSAPVPGGTDDMAAIVSFDPAIRTAADLAGKKVGVNALNNIASVSLRASIRKAQADPDSVELVELGFGEQAAAAQSGKIDAGYIVDPYLAIAKRDGAHVVTYPYLDVDPQVTISAYVATSKTVNESPEVVEHFKTALDRAAALLASDPEALRSAVTDFAEIDPTLYPDLAGCGFPTSINRASVTKWADLMIADGLLDKAPNLDTLLRAGA